MCVKFSCGVLFAVVSLLGSLSSRADVVNIDFDSSSAGNQNHVGDDGPLSTTGGTLWNQTTVGTDVLNLSTEFGLGTAVDLIYSGSEAQDFNDPGINDLQDSGAATIFRITGLVSGETYDIAVYMGLFGGFFVSNGPGFIGFGDPGADGWSLPGTEGNGGDYFLVTGLTPADFGNGEFGLEFLADGCITALQITGVSPEPSCIGDLDGDLDVDLTDLALLLSDFDCTSGCVGDVDGDGDTDLTDLALLLANFDQACG